MQQNVLRWFFEAYVNRLGMHLIELLSGRLAIGAHQYRRLTRRAAAGIISSLDQEPGPLTIAVAGARGSGKSRLVAAIKQACLGEMNLIKARVEPLGLAPACSIDSKRPGGSNRPAIHERTSRKPGGIAISAKRP